MAEWESLNAAETNVASEAAQTAEVLRDAAAFPPAQQKRIRQAIGDYVHAVVDRQWPLMHQGKPDASLTNPQVVRLYRVFQAYEPSTEAERAYYTEAVSSMSQVASARRTRLTEAEQKLPALLSVLVYGGALVMLPLTVLFGIRSRRAQLMFVCSVAGLIGVSLLLCFTLDRPFSAALSPAVVPRVGAGISSHWSSAGRSTSGCRPVVHAEDTDTALAANSPRS